MAKEVAPDNNHITFRAAVVNGRDSAIHNGFDSREKAERWAEQMYSKILANQRNLAKYAGRYPYES